MYNLNVVHSDNVYTSTLLYQRIYRLISAQNMGRNICILLRDDTYIDRYHIWNIEEAINGNSNWYAIDFCIREIDCVKEYLISNKSIVIIVRQSYSESLADFIQYCKKRNIVTGYEIDDLIFDENYLSELCEGTDCYDEKKWHEVIKKTQQAIHICDKCITTNEYLRDILKTKFEKDCYVVHNFYNAAQEEVSNHYISEKVNNKKLYEDEFQIGYFCGTHSHDNDFKVASKGLEELLSKYEKIKIKIVGELELPDSLIPFKKQGKIINRPFMDYVLLQREIAEADVNIVPLFENDFTHCKSEQKYFEASLVGTITCASPVYAYRKAIQRGKRGFLCEQAEWFSTLEFLYNQRNQLRKNMYNLRNEVQDYAYYNMKKEIENVFYEMRG